MAALLLLRMGRVGSVKVLQLEVWGLRGLVTPMLLCTKSRHPKKEPVKKSEVAAQSAVEESDHSTYKNLQHHSYTLYTFVDFDVQLEKHRQPQPSSGRLSPRH